ncbi:hypothetical protein D3C76_1137580 [compost metagenome]
MVRPAARASCPRASSTWDGVLCAELQADVAENAIDTPNATGLNSPSLKVRLSVWGIRRLALPFTRTPGKASSGSSKRLRNRAILASSSSNASAASSNAAPMAAIWWVARVPERKPPSCPPP